MGRCLPADCQDLAERQRFTLSVLARDCMLSLTQKLFSQQVRCLTVTADFIIFTNSIFTTGSFQAPRMSKPVCSVYIDCLHLDDLNTQGPRWIRRRA